MESGRERDRERTYVPPYYAQTGDGWDRSRHVWQLLSRGWAFALGLLGFACEVGEDGK